MNDHPLPPQGAAAATPQEPVQLSQQQQPEQPLVSQQQQAILASQQQQQPTPAQVPSQSAAVGFAFPTGRHNKVHHTYIWLGSLLGVGALVLFSMLSSLDDLVPIILTAGTDVLFIAGLALLLILVIYGLMVAFSALAYKHLSFVFDEKEFSLYSGVFNKQHVHVPYTRVQSVNHRQSLVQRLAGVCTVEIDTAGGAANKAIKVPYVKLDVGEAIRSDLFARKAFSIAAQTQPATLNQGAVASGQGALAPAQEAVALGQGAVLSQSTASSANVLDEAALDLGVDDFRGVYGGSFAGLEPVSFERRLNNKELALASISHSGVPGLFITAVLTVAVFVVPLVMYMPGLLALGALAIPVALVLFVAMLAVAAGTTALSYGSFSVRRRGERIEVERGILRRDFSGIDVNRVQSVVIRQSLVRRLMGYCEVSLGRVRASSGESQNTQASLNAGGLVVHPFLRLSEVDALLAGVLPEYADRPVAAEFRGLPKVAMRRGLLRNCIWQNGAFFTAVFFAAAQIVLNVLVPVIQDADFALLVRTANVVCLVVYVLMVLSTALIALGTFWWQRGSGFALNKRYAAICNDGLSTETSYFPRQKIQCAITQTNPFQRRAHVTSIALTTAAGVGGSGAMLWDVTEEDGAAWLEWLHPHTQAPVAL